MGNEQSELPGIEIEEKAVEVSDFWSQHLATVYGPDRVTNLSVFIGELLVSGSLWDTQTPLEKSTKNMMIYRHPCIVKYVSTWQKNSKIYTAVEEVTPLSQSIPALNVLSISIGLHSVIKALQFLHETAFVSHNNICISSIYITKDGSWKLGGMEFLCRYKELNSDYLKKTQPNRYNKSIDVNETKLLHSSSRKDFIDIYALGTLFLEIAKSKNEDEIPSLGAFREYCKSELQNTMILKRPTFKSILEQPFFNHDFISIHSFLVELPLKSEQEKMDFFQDLLEKLRLFDEVVVASQLSGLLLSRMVLLNKTARATLLPTLLTPQIDAEEYFLDSIFSDATFKKYLKPKLLEIFKVRDAQIRLLLLDNFTHFIHVFTNDELQLSILPELLVGIKDTNDLLVSVTLRTLADIVPILGAATVIGGKRAKLFNDSRPTISLPKLYNETLSKVEVVQVDHESSMTSMIIDSNSVHELPERPRPDGEEETSTDEVEQSVDEDLDQWEDWDVNDRGNNQTVESREQPLPKEVDTCSEKMSTLSEPKKTVPDISELDIKNQFTCSQTKDDEDVDFFQDMEPVIYTCNKFVIGDKKREHRLMLQEDGLSSKLALNHGSDITNEEGWGTEEWD